MHFLILNLDKPGTGALRQATRAAHRDYIWREDLPARLLTGSPLAGEDGQTMTGSWLLVEAPDLAAAKAFAAGDPYVLAGLFARMEVMPLWSGYDASVIERRRP